MSFPTNRQFTELIEQASAVVDHAGLRAVMRQIVAIACEATGARYGALGVIGSFETLTDFIFVGMPDELADRIGHLPVGHGVLGTLIRHPEPIVVDDITQHADFSGFPPDHPPMHTFLGVPVRAGSEVYGNLYLTEKDGGFSEDDAATAAALAAIAGGVVSSVRLHERLSELAVLEDRERIARDLHDSVIQDLFATGLSLQALSMSPDVEDAAGTRIEDAVDRIDTAIDTLRTFIFNLRRSATAAARRSDLRASLDRLCGRDRQLEVRLDSLDDLNTPAFESLAAVIREAVSNACRHGKASTISVVAERRGDKTRVTVTDDGIGFEPTSATRGLGLANISARVAELDGEVTIDSRPGAGTMVRVTLPVSRG